MAFVIIFFVLFEIDPFFVGMLNERNVPVISWTYKSKRSLQDLIRRYGSVNVVLLQFNEIILNHFRGSCRIKWIVMADQSPFNFSNFENDLFQHIQVLIVQSLPKKGDFAIKAPKLNGGLETVNSWSIEKGFANHAEFPPCPKREMKPLRIVMEKHFPFFQPMNGSDEAKGSDIKLLDSLAKALNFTYKIERPPDGSWGSRNGTKWNGMIRMLIKNQADAALSGMTATYDRYMAVRFSIPYAFDRYTYVTKRPSRKLKTWAIFWPYPLHVWASVAFSILIVSVLMTMLQNAMTPDNKKIHFSETALYIFQALLNQGHYNARETRCRILMAFWWGFCITLVAGYNGSLMSFMAHPGFEPALETVPQLVEAIRRRGFAAGTIKNSADFNLFKNSEESDLRVILEAMVSDEGRNLVAHDVDGLRECLRRDYAYVGGELTVRADVWDDRLFLFAEDSFMQYGYAIAFAPAFDHIRLFDKKILQLREAGLAKKWMEDIMERQLARERLKGGAAAIGWDDGEVHVLRVDDVQGAFSVLSIGLLVATIACIAEYHTHAFKFRRRNRRRQ